MAQQMLPGNEETAGQRRSRGPTRGYPSLSLEEVLEIGVTIRAHGLDSQMRRLSIFHRLEKSPTSGRSREQITNSNRYGLTTGSYQADHIYLTEIGMKVIDPSTPRIEIFEVAIGQFGEFRQLYDRLKERRLPAEDVLHDALGQIGVPQSDLEMAARVFLANARYVGLIKELSGSETLLSIEHVHENQEGTGDIVAMTASIPAEGHRTQEAQTPMRSAPSAFAEPSVHIDVQVHIDSTASAEQIDQIFASMARHLYGRE